MLIKVFGAAVQGIDATLITIEVNSSRGCMFYLVGLPDSAVKESHQRIISALQVNGYKMPTSNLVVNMAPADIRKEGSAYDLPLAIGLLGASETISSEKLSRYLMMGELSLDGSIQPIKGALPIAIKAREENFEGLIIPQQNAREAAVVNQLKVYGVSNIKEVIQFFNGERELEQTVVNTREEFYQQQTAFDLDFADVKGQENVKRALEVAAAGGHNLIIDTDLKYRTFFRTILIRHPAINFRTAKADPIMTPTCLIIRIIGMPFARKENKNHTSLDSKYTPTSCFKHPFSLCNINQLILRQYTSFIRIKIITGRMIQSRIGSIWGNLFKAD